MEPMRTRSLTALDISQLSETLPGTGEILRVLGESSYASGIAKPLLKRLERWSRLDTKPLLDRRLL